MASSVHWYCHVFRRDDGHVLIRALNFEVEGHWKKGRLKRTWKKQVEDKSVKVGLRREDTLCLLKWSAGKDQIAAVLRWIWPPSLVGDTAGLLLCWGEYGYPHLLGILPDCRCVEVNMATLTCWGYCRIAAVLRWICPSSLAGDTAGLPLCWGEYGHLHLLGILPDFRCVEVNMATLTCWAYCRIAAVLRWIWPPSLVGDTAGLSLCWGEYGHPHLMGILPDFKHWFLSIQPILLQSWWCPWADKGCLPLFSVKSYSEIIPQ